MIGLGAVPVPPATVDLDPTWISVGGVIASAVVAAIVAIAVAIIQRRAAREQTNRQLENQREQWDREVAAQREQFRDQVSHERQQWRLDSRRRTYVDFLVSVQKVQDLIDDFSEAVGALRDDGSVIVGVDGAKLDSLLNDLDVRYDEAFRQGQLVRLEGPQNVRDAAGYVNGSLVYLRNSIKDRVRSAKSGGPAERRILGEASAELHENMEAFISNASSVIDGGSPFRGV